ncbi:hypothetical protein BJX68DRAFT_267132 [Aspergillus pseudodeflectus]|uniref:F-box domain-containing protein n=1 Tax=Aspergillus pseudodeflectus TaxID=176178 RepID=A0ABR4KAH4_9EURO
MESLPIEILRTICILLRDGNSNDLCSFRRASHFHSQVATPVLFERLTVRLQSPYSCVETHDSLAELSRAGLGRHYLKYARTLSVVAIRNLLENHRLEYTTRLKALERNLFDHIPRAARDSFLDSALVTGVTPQPNSSGWKWIFDIYAPEDWNPLISLVSRLEHLTELNYGVPNIFPEPLLQTLATQHPDCVLNIWDGHWLPRDSDTPLERTGFAWSGYMPRGGSSAALIDRTLISSSPARHPPASPSQYSLDHLRSFCAQCPVAWQRTTAPPHHTWLQLTEHLPFLAACPNLQHLRIYQSSHSASYNEIVAAQAKWRALVSSTNLTPRARLHSLTIAGFGPREPMLSTVADIFDLSSLRSLDIHVAYDASILQHVAPRLSQLTRLFIDLDLERDDDPNLSLQENSPTVITAILAFHPLQHLCLRGARSPSSLHTILSHHGPSLTSLLIEVSEYGRSMTDDGPKFPNCSPADIAAIGASCPHLRDLRIPIQRTQGDPGEYDKYVALGAAFPNLHSLLLDLHCYTRTWPFNREWRPAGPALREILVNAATDSDLARGIWDAVESGAAQWRGSSSSTTSRLSRLTCIPFGANSLQLPEAHLVLSIGHSFLVERGGVGASQGSTTEPPVHVRRVGERALELEIGNKLLERSIGKELSKRLKTVFD